MHARKPVATLLPPARLIFLRPLADGAPHGAPDLSAADADLAISLGPAERDLSQPNGTPEQESSSHSGGQTGPGQVDSARTAAVKLRRKLLQQAGDVEEQVGAGFDGSWKLREKRGPQEQWDAVWLQPRQLLDEGLLLSAQWRRHHSGPVILAALSSALCACSS